MMGQMMPKKSMGKLIASTVAMGPKQNHVCVYVIFYYWLLITCNLLLCFSFAVIRLLLFLAIFYLLGVKDKCYKLPPSMCGLLSDACRSCASILIAPENWVILIAARWPFLLPLFVVCCFSCCYCCCSCTHPTKCQCLWRWFRLIFAVSGGLWAWPRSLLALQF